MDRPYRLPGYLDVDGSHGPHINSNNTTLTVCMISNREYAYRTTVHGTLKATPGSIAFNRDMVMDIPFIADLQLLQEKRQQLIDKRLIEANRRRISHDYQPGNRALKLVYKPNKLQPRAIGPYVIESVHTNGTVTLRLNATTLERISIRRIKPYNS